MTVNERVKWKLSGRGRVSVHLALDSRSLLEPLWRCPGADGRSKQWRSERAAGVRVSGGGACAGEGRALLCAARSLIPVTSCACGGVWRGNRSVYI